MIKTGTLTFLALTLISGVLFGQSVIAQNSFELAVIESDEARIEVSLCGAYPMSWTVTPLGAGSEPVALVDGDIAPTALGGPLQLVLDDAGGPLTNFAHSAMYSAEVQEQSVVLTSETHETGLQVVKEITIHEGYTGSVAVTLINTSESTPIELGLVSLSLGPGIGRIPSAVGGLGDAMYTFVDAVAFDGVRFVEIESGERGTASGFDPAIWTGVHDRYYAMLLLPEDLPEVSGQVLYPAAEYDSELADGTWEYYPAVLMPGTITNSLEPGEELTIGYRFFAGPKDLALLEQATERLVGEQLLPSTMDAGFENLLYSNLPGPLRWLCLVLGDLLRFMYGHIGSWWLTIVAFTVLIRIALFPLAQKSVNMNAKMMADQAKLKPLIDEIKKKHKNAQTQYDKTMALYKEYGINPLAPLFGCLPVLLQLPILIAIFNILGQEVTLQGARFLWINDLSLPDRLFGFGFALPYFGAYFNLLPVLMAVTMVLTTNLGSPSDGDQKKSQTRSMAVLAFIFFALFYSFPAGLVLYWTLSNLGQYAQQEITKLVIAKRAGAIDEDGTVSPE